MASNTHIMNLLLKIAEEQNYKNSDIKVLPVSTGGANYSSLLYTATIRSHSKEDLHLFIKVLVLSEKMKEQIQSYDSVINREKAFYVDIKQAYERLEQKYHVPKEHRFWLPKFYGSEVTASFEALVMENLAVKRFESFDRFKSMDWEYASKAVTELAKLHAASYALQINDPEEYKRICDKYVYDVMTETLVIPIWSKGVQNALPVLNDDDKRKFEKYANEFTYTKFTEYRETLKFTVIAHGDFRPSNFMHRVLEDGSLEVVVLDHQTFYLGSPIPDLLNLVASATDKKFRDQYYDKLVEYYYTQLSDALRRMNIDPEKTYSKDDFYAELKEKLPYCLVVATFVLPFITVETDQAPELKTDMDIDSMQVNQLGPLYPERMRDMVSDLVRWGVLSDLTIQSKERKERKLDKTYKTSAT